MAFNFNSSTKSLNIALLLEKKQMLITVLLKDNVANTRNFFAIYECVSSVTSVISVYCKQKRTSPKKITPWDAST